LRSAASHPPPRGAGCRPMPHGRRTSKPSPHVCIARSGFWGLSAAMRRCAEDLLHWGESRPLLQRTTPSAARVSVRCLELEPTMPTQRRDEPCDPVPAGRRRQSVRRARSRVTRRCRIADQNLPTVDRRPHEHARSDPRILGEAACGLAAPRSLDDHHCSVEPVVANGLGDGREVVVRATSIGERAAQEQETLIDQTVDEGHVLSPELLVAHRSRRIPTRTLLRDHDEVHRRNLTTRSGVLRLRDNVALVGLGARELQNACPATSA
jgi:hypothetical protein